MDFHLKRFIDAQQGCYRKALDELRNGRKQSHWMWFMFPQISGLGYSETARYFAISGVDEARAYLADELLGERLKACVSAVLAVQKRSLNDIFGSPDDLKFRSSMTLFEYAANDAALFAEALDRYCSGRRDDRTLQIIRQQSDHH